MLDVVEGEITLSVPKSCWLGKKAAMIVKQSTVPALTHEGYSRFRNSSLVTFVILFVTLPEGILRASFKTRHLIAL